MSEQKILEKVALVPHYQGQVKPLGANAPTFVTVQAGVSINTVVFPQTTNLHPFQIYGYTVLAEQLAIGLAQILSVLENYDRSAVYHIMSYLEPYIEEITDEDFRIPPKSEREALIKVTREGRVPPQFYDL